MATTWDPAKKDASITLSNGNLTATGTLATDRSVLSTLSHVTTGKYYFEILINAASGGGLEVIGLGNASTALGNFLGFTVNSIGWLRDNRVISNNSLITNINTWTTGDTLSVAVDLTAQLIWFRVNAGNWNNNGSANPATGVGGISISGMAAGPYFAAYTSGAINSQATANFGGSAFAQSVPSGFSMWDPPSTASSRALFIG